MHVRIFQHNHFCYCLIPVWAVSESSARHCQLFQWVLICQVVFQDRDFSSKWWCQQVCVGIAWLQWAMASGSSDNVEIRIFPRSVHILSHLAWGQCLVCCATMEACWYLTLWFSSSLGFLEVLCLGEQSYRTEILFVEECVGVEKLLCWLEMTWIYMNRAGPEKYASMWACASKVVPLRQEAYLNLREKEMNKHNARICGTQDCQDARGSFWYMWRQSQRVWRWRFRVWTRRRCRFQGVWGFFKKKIWKIQKNQKILTIMKDLKPLEGQEAWQIHHNTDRKLQSMKFLSHGVL